MKPLLKKTYNGELETSEDNITFEQAKAVLHARFYMEENAARYEEMKFENGAESVSLKDSSNKIIIQYKTQI
jgi:hypothetical protein